MHTCMREGARTRTVANMDRAARMLEAWPRFHEDDSHHTNSTTIAPNECLRTSSASRCAA